MRKKSIVHFFDTLMWYIVYTLPLILLLFETFRNGNFHSLYEIMSDSGLLVNFTNPVYSCLEQLFITGNVFPLFSSPDIVVYASYFICVFLLHLAVDVLLFIPRFAHKCMDCFGGHKS